jgi:hypothetical protein
MHIAAVLPLAILPFAFAANHEVEVGRDGLNFKPDKLNPAKDDTIVFKFYSENHSVAQSIFDNPCEFAENGIFSGFPGEGKTFTITVNNTEPAWLFCSEPGHCQAGQAMVLNEPEDNTLDEYKSAAQNVERTPDRDEQPEVFGGIVSDASTNATADATSSAASETVTSTSEGGPSATSESAATSAASATGATGTGAAGKFTAGAGLGAMGLLGVLVGGMI